MAEQRFLTDHNEIREWAIARAGKPMLHYIPDGTGGDKPVLSLAFGQYVTHDGDQGHSTEGRELVEWDDWLKVFDDQQLALQVPPKTPGVIEETHHFVKR